MKLEQHFLSKIKEALELNDNPIRFLEEYGFWKQEQQYNNMFSDIELFTEELKNKIDLFEYSVNQNSYISDYIKDWFKQFKNK